MAEDKEVKRLSYFKGQFLQEEDFNAEQAYHIRMRRLHNRALHTWGVVEGLEVTQAAGTNSIVVAPGIAIDKMGQEIVLPIPGSASVPITGVTKGDVFITISYGEADDPLDAYTTAGVEGKFKKKTERPLPPKADPAPPAGASLAVLLAKVSVDGGNVVAIDNNVRRLVNSSLFSSTDLEVRSLKWGNNSRLQTDQGGSIELGGDPNTPGTGTPYIDFHFGPKAAEDFNVRLINDANGTLSIQGKVLQVTGSAGIGTPTPGARLTIQQGSTPAGSAANGKGLFVSALMGTGAASDGGIEFRHDNLTQGIGFGYNTIYATGSNANQDLAIQSRGTGSVLLNPASGNVGIGSASAPRAKLQVTGGAIMPAAGNSETSGIMFPKDPGAGSGDAAWIRYYARTGEPSTENTTLEIGTSNDPQDHIALMASGNVGVGIVNPTKKLTVSTSATSPDGVLVAGSDNHFALTAPSLGQGSFNGITRAGDAGIIYSGGTPGTGAFVIAPWTDAVSGLRIDANGNVGLGIAAPIDKLHVEAGSILIRGEGTGLIVDEGPNKRVGFLKYAGREAGIWRLNAQDFEIGRLNPEVTSLPGAPTAFTTDLSVGANGSVGIGTPTPDRNLTITRTPAQNERPSAVEGIYANIKNVTHEILIGVDSTAILSAMTASDLQFRTNNITRMLIQANTGNVGIGTAATGRKLVVDGNSTIFAGVSNWGEGLRIIAKGSDTFAATFYGRADEDAKALWFTGIGSFADNNRESDLIFLSGPGRGSPDTPAFTSSSLGGIYRGDAAMVLEHSTGNALFGSSVGIGNSTPNEKLVVEGNIRLNEQSSLLLRSGADPNHGIGYFGSARPFASQVVDGPVVFGWLGGILGTTAGGPRVTLRWNSGGGVDVGPVAMPGGQGRLMASGTTAEVGFLRRNLTVWPATPAPGDRFLWYNQEGSMARLWTEGVGDLVTVDTAGNLRAKGGVFGGNIKGGYVGDQFINNLGESLEQGDVVVVGENQSPLYYGANNSIPIPEVDLARAAYDTRVCGIVAFAHFEPSSDKSGEQNPGSKVENNQMAAQSSEKTSTNEAPVLGEPFSQKLRETNSTRVEPDQIGWMVTLGAYAHCKVDADIAPIKVGDLLTTSRTAGHAQKVLDQKKATGAIIGKALGSLSKGRGKIPVLVTLQ